MTITKQQNWKTLVLQADPNHTRDSRVVPEYEFANPPGGDPKKHEVEGGKRVFKGDYQTRGPYGD